MPFITSQKVLTVIPRSNSSSMRRLFSTLLLIVLLLVVLEATAINDNEMGRETASVPFWNSTALTARKIQEQQQGNGNGNDNDNDADGSTDNLNFNGRDDYVDDTSREIDCDRFPLYCQENGKHFKPEDALSQGTGEPAQPGSEDDSPSAPPANTVALRVSVGMTDANRLSQLHLAGYTALVITSLLDRYSPFSVKHSALTEPQNRELGSLEEEKELVFEWFKGRTRLTQEVAGAAVAKGVRKRQRVLVSKRSLLNGDIAVKNKNQDVSTQEQHRHQRQIDHDNLEQSPASGKPEHLLQPYYGDRDENDNIDPENSNGNNHNYNRIQSDAPPPTLAKMFLWDTQTELVGDHEQEWIVIRVSYMVFRKTDQPIVDPRALQNITEICTSVLNSTIVSGHFLDYLRKHIQEGQDADDPNAAPDNEDVGDVPTLMNPNDGEYNPLEVLGASDQ
jgi:hypothetical protein